MAAIPRKTQNLFGSSLVPTGNVAQWGSALGGAPVFSNDLAVIQGLSAWLNGLNGEMIGNRSPSWQEMNAFMLLVVQQIAYILQTGVAGYDAGTTYFKNNVVREDATGLMFMSMSDNNTGNPLTDTNNWANYFAAQRAPTLCLAWAVFDGINTSGPNARLINSFNITQVVKNAPGSYTLAFANLLPSANYVVAGSCGSEGGAAYGPGDDGVVVGNVAGQGNAVRSNAICRVFTINPTSKALVSSGCVSVMIFGS